ncbi:MAG: hypothetical protein PHG66_00815 [Candidatus Colwellbacteria bacterium]|nr:hypothetical protein [Candidatus Colwellbacteria bacterium]
MSSVEKSSSKKKLSPIYCLDIKDEYIKNIHKEIETVIEDEKYKIKDNVVHNGWTLISCRKEDKPNWTKNNLCNEEFLNKTNHNNKTYFHIYFKQYSSSIVMISYGGIKTYENKKLFKDKISLDKNLMFEEEIKDFDSLIEKIDECISSSDNFDDVMTKYWSGNVGIDGVSDIKEIVKDIKFSMFESVKLFDKKVAEFKEKYKNLPFPLPDYDKNEDIKIQKSGKIKQSETAYNSRICKTLDFINLDCDTASTNGIEIADIYNKTTKQLIHVKKEGDLRVHACQGLNSALYLDDPNEKSGRFKDIHDIPSDPKSLTIVYAIICMNNKVDRYFDGNTPMKDKISLGTIMSVLEFVGYTTELFYINAIN